jgi:glucoselysine-6-phosphate deglycase
MPVYDGDMLTCMYEMKGFMRNILENPSTSIKEAVDYVCSKNIEQIYVIGSGTSYHAAVASKKVLEELLDMKVIPMYPMQFKDNERVFNKNTLVIGISHGGTSTSTIQALHKAADLGLATIACTAVHDSVLLQHADAKLYVEIGVENVGPKTKGYQGCIVTLYKFAMDYALTKGKISQEDVKELNEDILNATDATPDIMRAFKSWYEANADELKKAKRIIVTGYEENVSSVLEGTLKVLETIRRSVVGYELEEFLHGIYNAIDNETYMIYLGSKGQYYQRLLKLKGYLDEKTQHGFLITFDEEQKSIKNFVYPFVSGKFSSLQYIVPMQMLANLLSKDLGINCNIPSDPQFHKKMNSKIIK